MLVENSWENFVKTNLDFFGPKISDLGFILDEEQIHTKGERSAFRAKKIILSGKRISDNLKVIIKVTREKEGEEEIIHEKKCREALKKVDFAYHEFLEPPEIYFETNSEYTIQITEFIEEEIRFLNRDPKEQFQIALTSFVTQEGIHAVTSKHNKIIQKYFENFSFIEYSKMLETYKKIILEIVPTIQEENNLNFEKLLNAAEQEFKNNKKRIEQYCGFLTHTDFVPHNFRVRDSRVYLLDHSAIRIGNKHEGWGRFLNFMLLHNTILYEWFMQYFLDNRSVEENESLRLMRIFRLFDLIHHHAKIFSNSDAQDLKELSAKRVVFWSKVLESVVANSKMDKILIDEYKNSRDTLRSKDEKERQKVLY